MKKSALVSISCLLASMFTFAACGGNKGSQPQNITADKYEITIACQTEESEKEVLEVLKNAYMAKHSDTKINVKTFTGKDFDTYMNGLAQQIEGSPNIIWTSDSYHARWDNYFTDLRPFYEASAETDYSLYYESMLDTAATNGDFKPTKAYSASEGDDGKEYGLYFAPRDYNKPVLLCNTHLFTTLDAQYEEYYKEANGGAMAADYQLTTARLNDIVAGNNWDDINDLFAFSKMIAERLTYVIQTAESKGAAGAEVRGTWRYITALDLKLSWEPSYVTIMNAMGVDGIIGNDGALNLAQETAALETLHANLYPEGVNNLYYSSADDTNFAQGITFMKVVSRPVVLGYKKNFTAMYGSASLQSIQIPTADIAAGCSGYAINNYYHNKSVTVNGVTKSYDDICWDFLKFIITQEGQEVAGATGSNIPVLKGLRDSDTAAWKNIEGLENMNDSAWVAGGELKQDWFNIYTAKSRINFRTVMTSFFTNFAKQNYNEGSLADLIKNVENAYSNHRPANNIR